MGPNKLDQSLESKGPDILYLNRDKFATFNFKYIFTFHITLILCCSWFYFLRASLGTIIRLSLSDFGEHYSSHGSSDNAMYIDVL